MYKQDRMAKKIFGSCVVKAGKGEHSVEFAERPNQQPTNNVQVRCLPVILILILNIEARRDR